MIDNEEARRDGWTPSETKPGYLTKTLKYKNCTIVVNRPIFTPEEQKKQEQQVCRNLERALQGYYARKEKQS